MSLKLNGSDNDLVSSASPISSLPDPGGFIASWWVRNDLDALSGTQTMFNIGQGDGTDMIMLDNNTAELTRYTVRTSSSSEHVP